MNPYLTSVNVTCDTTAGSGSNDPFDSGGSDSWEDLCVEGTMTTYVSTTTVGGAEEMGTTIMVSVKMHNPDATRNHIFNRSSEDPERKYHVYRFTYEL